uniref:Adhesion G protein-coupled receptor E8 n=1 Tax=Salarias fasciatus TaxID=181472 RepID=A0A672F604_SALFA
MLSFSDIDECFNSTICGPDADCTNKHGSHSCACHIGYKPTQPDQEPISGLLFHLCSVDVDECAEDATICGPNANCTNSVGSYVCSCHPGYRLNDADTIESHSDPCIGLSINLSAVLFHLYAFSVMFLIATLTPLCVLDLSFQTVVPGGNSTGSSTLSAKENTMDINLEDLAKNNNGSAAAAFLTLNGMENLLSHQYFKTENKTEMFSDVLTAVVPSMNHTNLTEPVNFTIHHKKMLPKSGFVTCVYWENKTKTTETGGGRETEKGNTGTMRWSVDGCWTAYSDENRTMCSCSHLSTFALILQIGEVCQNSVICVIVGLFFFALAVFTFLLCSWNPKINNTARLHLCLNLGLSHLLLQNPINIQLEMTSVSLQLACTVMAALLHFLVVASFVWMLLEAFQLYLLVRRLSKVQVIQRDGLPKLLLYLIGYGVPFVIVGVSALVYSDGYGATEADSCWLSQKQNFNWALTGPVLSVLKKNKKDLHFLIHKILCLPVCRLILFKIVAQFVILGCTWILGLYQTNLFFQVLFIVLNSQQGTFLYIVHCLLNKEVKLCLDIISSLKKKKKKKIKSFNHIFLKDVSGFDYCLHIKNYYGSILNIKRITHRQVRKYIQTTDI